MIICKDQLGSRHFGSIANKTRECRNNFSDGVGISSAPTARKTFLKNDFGINGIFDNRGECRTMTSLELNDMMTEGIGPGVMILDLRDSRQYQNGHIITAKSANCTSRLMSKKTVLDLKKNLLDNIQKMVLYDQHSDLPSSSSPQMLLINYLREERKEIIFLQGGYDEFKKICHSDLIETLIPRDKMESYQHSPTNAFIVNSEDVLNAVASRILPFLYIGNERDSADFDLLNELGITHILNVTSTSPFYFKNHNRFQYRRLPANDNHMQNLRSLYEEAFDFIDDARHRNGQILVHCWAGVSRSPSIVMAYILKHSNLNVFEALQLVVNKRSVIGPNINFMGQLERFYVDLNQNLEKRNVDLFANDHRC